MRWAWVAVCVLAWSVAEGKERGASSRATEGLDEAPANAAAEPALWAADAGTHVAPLSTESGPVDGEALGTPSLSAVTDAPDTPLSPDGGTPSGPQRESVVTGKALDVRRVAGSAHVITQEKLERSEYNDIHRVLQEVPGVYLRDEDGYGLRPNIGMRGASSDRSSKVTLMEDGVLLGPAPYSAPAAYYFPLVTRMTSAEIYKGPAAIAFGPQTVGGALDLHTRNVPASGGAGALDVSYGKDNALKLHTQAGYGGKRFGVWVEGLHLQSDGFKQVDGGGNTGFDKNELMLKLEYRGPTAEVERSRFELKLGYADERSNETYLGLTDADFAFQHLRRYAASAQDQMNWTRIQAELRHVWQPSKRFELTTVAYWHHFNRTWRKLNGFAGREGSDLFRLLSEDQGTSTVYLAILRGEADSTSAAETLLMGTNDRRFISQGLQSDGQFELAAGKLTQTLAFGARLHHDAIERHHTEDPFWMVDGQLEAQDGGTVRVVRNLGFTRALAAYVRDELSYGRWLVAPGVRLEVFRGSSADRLTGERRASTDVALLPGLGVVRDLGFGLTALGGVHRGFSPVSPGQPSDVKPEWSLNYEGGMRYRSKRLRAELVGFFNDYENLTGECTLSSGCSEEQLNRQYNGGQVAVYGLEAGAGVSGQGPRGGRLGLDVTYTFTRSRFLTSFRSGNPQFGDVEVGDALPYVPVHEASATAWLSSERWGASLTGIYVGAMREVAGQGPLEPGSSTDAHFILDAAVYRELFGATRLYATVNNVLDAHYVASRRPYGARPGAPLQFQVGVKQSF